MNDIHQLTGAYALDAVDDVERARFERHLATCEDCRHEVDSLREAAAMLPESVAVEPPAALRGAVLAGIGQVRPLPPPTPEPTPAAPRPALRRWLPLLVAAVVATVLGVGATVWQPWSTDDTSSLSATERVLQAPDAQTVALDLGAAGRARVVRSPSLRQAVLVTEDMVSAPPGKVYEVWLQDDAGAMLPAALMPDRPDQSVLLDGDAAAATGAGITVEPDGGSTAPTSDPIALFEFERSS